MRDFAAGVPICGIVGINGAGKTLIGASIVISRMVTGREVYSTVPIEYTDPKSGESWSTKPVLSLEQLLHLRDVTVFFDDVSVILPAGNLNLPDELMVLLQTLRHKGIDVIWSAPGWMRANNQLRLITQGVIVVQPWLRHKAVGTPWPTPRLVYVALMDTTSGKADATPDVVLRRGVYRPTKLPSFGAYDTLADTPVLRTPKQTSRCASCGGSVPLEKHSKERHESLGLPWYEETASSVFVADAHSH